MAKVKTLKTKKEAPKKDLTKNKGRPPPPEASRWKKGQSGNPLGAQLHNAEMRVIKNLTSKELVDIGNLVVKGNFKALQAIKDDENSTIIQMMVAAVCMKVMRTGDMGALDILLNRLVGKVKEQIQFDGKHEAIPPRVVVSLPSNGKEAPT